MLKEFLLQETIKPEVFREKQGFLARCLSDPIFDVCGRNCYMPELNHGIKLSGFDGFDGSVADAATITVGACTHAQYS